MIEDKLERSIESIKRALENYRNKEKLKAKGDLDFARENIEESIYLILAEIEYDDTNINEKEVVNSE